LLSVLAIISAMEPARPRAATTRASPQLPSSSTLHPWPKLSSHQQRHRGRDNAARVAYDAFVSVTEIIDAVKRLDEREKGEFLDKLADIDFNDAWDRQIEDDAKAGRLDRFAEEAIREYRAGNSRPLP
jgi:hypothetical protein